MSATNTPSIPATNHGRRRGAAASWLGAVACLAGLAACGSSKDTPPPPPDDDGGGGSGSGDGSAAGPRSCADLPATCGATGAASCCDSPEVVGGTFYRGYDLAGDSNSGAANHPATVSRFRLDRYEITVGRFRAFVQAGKGTRASAPAAGAGAHASIGGSGWDASWSDRLPAATADLVAAVKCNATFQTWTDTPGANEERPMNCLTWYEAAAFCAWDGGRLPTEAEWNYAAAGGEQQRAYPWGGDGADGTRASYLEAGNCLGDGASGCAATDIVKVGTKPAGEGRWGHADLAGNVAEWTLDAIAVYPTPCTDCATTQDGDRVTRGGNFGRSAFYMRTGTRSAVDPGTRNHGLGARCARAM